MQIQGPSTSPPFHDAPVQMLGRSSCRYLITPTQHPYEIHMHNQYSPYLLKASLPTAVAAALLSFAQMANSTVTDYSPDFSNAVEISFNKVTATNPTQADRGWFGTTTSSNHCGLEFKLTNSQMRDVDVIGAWRTSSGTYDSQVRENKLLIAGSPRLRTTMQSCRAAKPNTSSA